MMHLIITIIISVCSFYILLLWFHHKANIRFRKMDGRVGNIDKEATNETSTAVTNVMVRELHTTGKNQAAKKEGEYVSKGPEIK